MLLIERNSSHFTTEFLPRTLNPFSPYNQFSFLKPFNKSPNLKFQSNKRFQVVSFFGNPDPNSIFLVSGENYNVCSTRDVRSYAGRSKKTGGASSFGGRLEGNADFRRRLRRSARAKSKKLAESLFYRLKNPKGRGNYPDNFSEE